MAATAIMPNPRVKGVGRFGSWLLPAPLGLRGSVWAVRCRLVGCLRSFTGEFLRPGRPGRGYAEKAAGDKLLKECDGVTGAPARRLCPS